MQPVAHLRTVRLLTLSAHRFSRRLAAYFVAFCVCFHCLILKSSSLAVGRSSMKSPLFNTLSWGGPCRENQYLQISSKYSRDMALILSTLFSTGRLSGVISSSPSVGHAPRRWVTPRLMNRTKIPFLSGCQCRFCISLEKTARGGAWRGRCIVDGQ